LRIELIRILIVEDFEHFRKLLTSILKQRADLSIVAEASDGVEAVREAQRWRPDLILLDIGLPKLNGIEVARQVRKFLPACKILVVSQESADDVIEEALRAGADGYLAKADVGTYLLSAIDVVRTGRQFLGYRAVN
jgi:DNA-binding NarL/FixJ family response regulator